MIINMFILHLLEVYVYEVDIVHVYFSTGLTRVSICLFADDLRDVSEHVFVSLLDVLQLHHIFFPSI